ncbi:hypothetical protein WICMUC_003234 [Wickerhamomyces mucosus]|uniref:Glycoside hydrolase family 5 domain-containing protein n=1 Tax=Wickerhamomyces mucosus TaxID=1378264 RepID=A0A9P8PMX1_9ASCO|nr:hypothetical protein WICMUC_003234 [Wickerhamomyces mucosus]
MGVIEKLKRLGIKGSTVIKTPSGPAAPTGCAPDTKSIYRNRQNFGVNFGSLFVLEKFIFDELFIDGTATELDAITAFITAHGEDKTREVLENHWKNYLTDEDWKWLKSNGITAVRIPIGYWHINEGKFTENTPFVNIASVYKSAWSIFKGLIENASQYQIGILVDLHALPGGANTADHSGCHLENPEFWSERRYQELAVSVLEFISNEIQQFENVIGLQIVNESIFDKNADSQQHYYSKAIKQIRSIDSNIPIIISDGWWPDQWVKWINNSENNLKSHSGVVIDAHIYRCFSDSDRSKSPEQIIQDLDSDVLTNLSGVADFIVGEYSCVLDGSSWDRSQHDRNELVKRYGNTLSKLFAERANFGSFFWTFKFQHGDGGEWGFIPQVNSGNIIPLSNVVQRESNEQEFKKILSAELEVHSNYWEKQNKNENYEHWRYQEGFTTAWVDSVEFSRFNGSRLGRVSAWKSSRRVEHIKNRHESKHLWEWDQGFDKGLEKAKQYLFD